MGRSAAHGGALNEGVGARQPAVRILAKKLLEFSFFSLS